MTSTATCPGSLADVAKPGAAATSGAPATFGVVLFDTTQGAIRAERVLLDAGVRLKLIPVPRHLSANCGFAVRFSWEERRLVAAVLGECRMGIKGIEPL